ncbi:hypothetical protein Sjap_023917 [Stephania japonica]|uniref:Uncharacterized protein n=1 Tax=Stephania japonica TaxID=461633 RepID=A0AAP0EEL1_9MAGN
MKKQTHTIINKISQAIRAISQILLKGWKSFNKCTSDSNATIEGEVIIRVRTVDPQVKKNCKAQPQLNKVLKLNMLTKCWVEFDVLQNYVIKQLCCISSTSEYNDIDCHRLKVSHRNFDKHLDGVL